MIRLRDNIQLNPNQYVIKIKGVPVSDGEILFDHYMAMNPGYVEEEITGIPTFEPSFHLPAIWITESQRERAETMGYTVVDPPSIIATHLTEVIRTHIDELLTRQDVQNLINNVQESNATLIGELVPKLLSIGEIQKVLQNLLKEGISIRDLITIFETLADYATTTRDTDVLTEYARQSLKRAYVLLSLTKRVKITESYGVLLRAADLQVNSPHIFLTTLLNSTLQAESTDLLCTCIPLTQLLSHLFFLRMTRISQEKSGI